jgi:hypothetical protein
MSSIDSTHDAIVSRLLGMRIFVTGASGFIGGHAVERFVRDGHEVLALARSPSSAAAVERLGARAVKGELGAVDPAALAGCDAVVHAAAFVSEWGTREQFWAANVEGTSQLLEAARQAGVRRFIHIGTEAALFDGRDLVDIDEDHPYPTRQRFLYSETKAEAERRVLAANGAGLTTIVLRPRLVWGPRDTSVRAAIVEAAKAGRFAWVGGGRALTSTVHVANLAHAIALALERGRGGQAYFIADDGTRTLREFLTAYLDAGGVALGSRQVPTPIARLAAAVVEGIWRLFRRTTPPPLTRFSAAMMGATITVRTDKARRELGYAPILTVDEGLRALRGAPPAAA